MEQKKGERPVRGIEADIRISPGCELETDREELQSKRIKKIKRKPNRGTDRTKFWLEENGGTARKRWEYGRALGS